MKSEDILKTLGYLTLVVIAIYVLFGMLEIGGKGLASIGNKSIMEGLEDRQLDRLADSLQKKLDAEDELSERYGDQDDELDQVEDLPEYKDMIEVMKDKQIRLIRQDMKKMVLSGGKGNKQNIIDNMLMIQAMELVSGGGGAAQAASKISGGLF